MAKLVVISQGLAGLSLELGGQWTAIGRGYGNALQIIETSVSGKHCEVRLQGNELHIRDLRSTNGTFVRGQKITEAVIRPGQVVRLGQVEARFEMDQVAPVPAVPAAPVVPVVPAVPVPAPTRAAVPSIPVTMPPAKPAPTPVPTLVPVVPAVVPASAAPVPKVEPAAPAPRRFQVLFVDDNETFLAMFTELCAELSGKQWEMHVAATADRALEVLRRQAIDLAILDIGMPLLDGIQLLGIVKRRYHDLKIAVLTANATEANRTASLTGGAELFIEKPVAADGFKVVFNMLNDLVSWAPQREGFSGTVRQVGLQEVIQMECLGRHSSVLEVRNQRAQGQIFIESGVIVHAEAGDLLGEAGLQRLLSLAGGEFRLLPFKTPKARTINGSWEFLLMEAARVRDEEHHTAMVARKAVKPEGDKPGQTGAEAGKPPAPAPAAAEGGAKAEEPKKETPLDSNAHLLGEDIVVVATYDGKWHPSNSPKK